MERGKAFSIMLGRLQHELCRGYGVDNARKVLQGALDSNDVVFAVLLNTLAMAVKDLLRDLE